MRKHVTICRPPRSAMTLLELVIVLSILAALTTVAMQSVSQLGDQVQFETTRRTLTQLETAIVGQTGPANSPGSVSAGSFVADHGRLPATLEELVIGGSAYSVQPVDAALSSGVVLPVGWRGPYLRLPLGVISPVDGWGRPLEILADGSSGTLSVGSSGADFAVGGTGYNTDLSFTLAASSYQGSLLTVKLYSSTSSLRTPQTATIKLYRPDTSLASGIRTFTFPTSGDAQDTYIVSPASVSPSPLMIGPAVVQAFQGATPSGSPSYVNIVPGSQVMLEMFVAPPVTEPETPTP